MTGLADNYSVSGSGGAVINHGLYTDTVWAVPVTFKDTAGQAINLAGQPYVAEIVSGSTVIFRFRSSGAAANEGTLGLANAATGVIMFNATIAQHGSVAAGLYRVHLKRDLAEDVWTSEGTILIGKPGAKETYLLFDAPGAESAGALSYAQQAAASAATAVGAAAAASTDADDAAASATAAASSQSAAAASATAAAASQSAAASSQSAAAGSATAAASSASAAAASEAAADVSEAASSTSATAAAGSATASQNSRLASEAARDASVTAKTASESARDAAVVAKTAAETAETNAETAEVAAEAAQAAAEAARNAAQTSATQASTSKDAAAASATAAASSASAASADRVLAETARTGAETARTGAQTAQTAAETARTAAQTAQTGAETARTAAQTAQTAAETARTGAQAAQTAAAGSQATATSAAQTATAQASLAQGYAASASSVVQQDLSAVTAQALHRSPNAITSMFIYDTSKDSDGGAWTEKCQHTSWWNEPLMGKWLGARTSEFDARYFGATLGAELAPTPDFSSSTGWTLISGATISNGQLTLANQDNSRAEMSTSATYVAGDVIEVTLVITAMTGTPTNLYVQGITTGVGYNQDLIYLASPTVGTHVFRRAMTAGYSGVGAFRIIKTPAAGTVTIDSISIKKVTAATTNSGDYFQLTTDGKFYRLWKNIFSRSEDFADGAWTKQNTLVTANATTTYDGQATAAKITNNATGLVARSVRQGNFHLGAQTYTLSVEAKASEITSIYLDIGQGWGGAQFDLTTGATSAVVAGTTASAQSLGNGWYRCRVTAYVGDSGNRVSTIYIISNGISADTPIGNGVFLTRAQLELATAFTSYEVKAADGAVTETFRGNKADFPRLAAIVAEVGNVNIYDLTEPGRPMWMRFFPGSGNEFSMLNGAYAGYVSTPALNGIMPVCSSGIYGGLRVIDFPKDTAKAYRSNTSSNGSNGIWRSDIARRNTSVGYEFSNLVIANDQTNAAAMTVLPDAPVDPETGLRVPTIAVATSSGVSLIKHNGTVVNSSSTNAANTVILTPAQLEWGISSSAVVNNWLLVKNPGSLGAGFAASGTNWWKSSNVNDITYYTQVLSLAGRIRGRLSKFAPSPFMSLTLHNPDSTTKGLGVGITNVYNTGWLPGDIRRAYLSDIDVGTVSGTELVTNGTFNTDTSGWTATEGSTLSVVSGALRITDTDFGYAHQDITTVVGKTYAVSFNGVAQSNGSNQYYIQVGVGANKTSIMSVALGSSNGTFSRTFVATATTTRITLAFGGAGGYADFDNISVQEIISDRSYKAAISNITGTLSRAQLASGTSLVGYSGFSASNYLREPYSADLDFGTGEWSCSAWVNMPASALTANYPVYGSDLLAGAGAFTSSAGWSGLSADCTISGGSLAKTGGSTHYVRYPLPTLTQGDVVLVKFDVVATNAIFDVRIGHAPGWNAAGGVSTVGTHYRVFTAFNVGYGNFIGFDFPGTITAAIQNLTVYRVKPSAILSRSFSSGPYLELAALGGNYLRATASDGTTTRTVTFPPFTGDASNPVISKDVWLKAEACYTTDGTLSIRVNGREMVTSRGNPLLTLSNGSAVLTIGNNYTLDGQFPGTIALLKLSATVPTYEQSQFMYEQEKQLFRAGAQSVLPDSGSIVDMSYDDATDRWVAVSPTNESYWTGLVRNSVTPSPAGSYTKIAATSGIELVARNSINPGVDVTIPAYGLREELVKRAEAAARLTKEIVTYDYVGGFTANTTTGNTAITNVSTITYPASYIGARISGSGIPANTTIAAVSGTTIYLSAAATATASGVSISFLDFELPVGMEAKTVITAGAVKIEGTTKDYTRLYDGFIETIRFGVAPGATAAVQIQAQRITLQ